MKFVNSISFLFFAFPMRESLQRNQTCNPGLGMLTREIKQSILFWENLPEKKNGQSYFGNACQRKKTVNPILGMLTKEIKRAILVWES